MGQIVKYQANDGVEVTLTPETVAAYIATGNAQADMADVVRFMATCRARGLNPLAGDAYLTVFKGQNGQKSVSTITSKDYFVRTAHQQPTFDGIRAGVVVVKGETGEPEYREGSIVLRGSETLVGGWAEVYDKACARPSRAEVSLDEYDQHRSVWKTKPATMIRKVALVQALREMYPAQFGGVYDGDEMPADIPPAPEPQPVAATVEQPAQGPQAATVAHVPDLVTDEEAF